ncbi:unnamed protein product, partial [Protopolystoma xenopodis]
IFFNIALRGLFFLAEGITFTWLILRRPGAVIDASCQSLSDTFWLPHSSADLESYWLAFPPDWIFKSHSLLAFLSYLARMLCLAPYWLVSLAWLGICQAAMNLTRLVCCKYGSNRIGVPSWSAFGTEGFVN